MASPVVHEKDRVHVCLAPGDVGEVELHTSRGTRAGPFHQAPTRLPPYPAVRGRLGRHLDISFL